jgi:hypothetical protein
MGTNQGQSQAVDERGTTQKEGREILQALRDRLLVVTMRNLQLLSGGRLRKCRAGSRGKNLSMMTWS